MTWVWIGLGVVLGLMGVAACAIVMLAKDERDGLWYVAGEAFERGRQRGEAIVTGQPGEDEDHAD